VNIDSRQHGPLTTDEINQQRLWWIKQVQAEAKGDPKCQNDSVQFNIQADANEILKCKGRVQGQRPIYLSDSSLFALKFAGPVKALSSSIEETIYSQVGVVDFPQHLASHCLRDNHSFSSKH
jgi:hypothetical protein